MLVASACGPDPLERYFDQVESITRTMQRDSVAALPDPSVIDRNGISGVNDARQRAVTALEAVVPATEVTPEHAALVLALSDLTAAGTEFLAATSGLATDEFTAAVLASSDLDQIAQRVAAACTALENRASALGYSNRFSC
jgi:hypothetical protein